MARIIYKGMHWTIDSKEDLAAWREEHANIYPYIRTSSKELIQFAVELYLDELDRQDAKKSTGSYGKIKEVYARVDYALEHNGKMFLHDVRCRKQGMVDQMIKGEKIEHKTSFAQWEYGHSYEECMEKLECKAAAGYVWSWDPFKDGREIVMPLSDLLDYLAQYNPKKGLAVWFDYKSAKGQLQVQPVTNSKKRAQWIESLLED